MMHSTESEEISLEHVNIENIIEPDEIKDVATRSYSSTLSTIDTTWQEEAASPEVTQRRPPGCYVRVNFPLPSKKAFKEKSISFVNLELDPGDFSQLSVSDLKQLVFAALIQNMEFMHVQDQASAKKKKNLGSGSESDSSEHSQNNNWLGWMLGMRGNDASESCQEKDQMRRQTTNQANSMIGTTVHLYSGEESFLMHSVPQPKNGQAPSSVGGLKKSPLIQRHNNAPVMIKLPALHHVVTDESFAGDGEESEDAASHKGAGTRSSKAERAVRHLEYEVDDDGTPSLLHALHGDVQRQGSGIHEDATGRMAYIHDPARMRQALLKGPDAYVFKLGQEADTDPNMRWLTDEDESLGMIAQATEGFEANRILELWLISQHKAPIPRIFCTIASHEQAVDAFSKPFTQYCIKVRYERMEWRVYRRFSEFYSLHKKLQSMAPGSSGYIRKKRLPKFPHKQIHERIFFQHTGNEQRERELEAYIVQLTAIPESNENIEILGFLGVISTRQEEINSMRPDRAPPKLLVHLNALAQNNHLEWGDVLMFKCNNAVSKLQRRFTGAEWDHIAIIVQEKMGGPLLMMEATGDGVRHFPVVQRIRAYGNEFTQYIALRKLKAKKTMVMYNKMLDFVTKVIGKPYGFSLGRLLNRSQEKIAEPENGVAKTIKPNRFQGTGENYFCSELVAACLQYMGVLKLDRNCSSFWPGSFGSGGDVDNECLENFCFGDEIIIDCHVLEIGSAKH